MYHDIVGVLVFETESSPAPSSPRARTSRFPFRKQSARRHDVTISDHAEPPGCVGPHAAWGISDSHMRHGTSAPFSYQFAHAERFVSLLRLTCSSNPSVHLEERAKRRRTSAIKPRTDANRIRRRPRSNSACARYLCHASARSTNKQPERASSHPGPHEQATE